MRRKPRVAQEIQRILSSNPGILSIHANPLTGGILVLYDQATFHGDIGALLQAALDDLARRGAPRNGEEAQLANPILRLLLRTGAADRELTIKAVVASAASAFLFFVPAWGLAFLFNIVTRRQGYALLARFGLKRLRSQVLVLGLLTIAASCAWSIAKYFQKKYWVKLAAKAESEIRSCAFAHIQQLDLAFFDNQSTGALTHIFSGDAANIGRFLEQAPGPAIEAATSGIIVVTALLFTSPLLALPVCLPLIGFLLISRYIQRQIAPLYADMGMHSAELSGLLSNNLSGISTIKSFTAEDREARRVREKSEKVRKSYERAATAGSAYMGVQMALFTSVGNLTLTIGASSVLRGTLSMGSFVTLGQMIPVLFSGVSQIDALYDLYQNASESAESAMRLLDTRPQIKTGSRSLAPSAVRGEIVYDKISFAYQPGYNTLQDLDLRVSAGQTVGVVGATGAGKTTLVKLLLRFYDTNGGTISIDGVDTKDLQIHDLRHTIGFVSQDVYLFDGSVHDNIAYGRPGASREEVERAAHAAEAHEFILRLPNGYDTVTGERGQRLSAGQRQRISIARAVIKDAPILVLDEATASVDNETEAAILRSIEHVGANRSMIIIAHRLSTVRNADCIYVIDHEHVREKGTHDELLELGGLYASLWRVQTGAKSE